MKSIPVFYTPKMVVSSERASPSAGKPAAVVASWKEKFPIEIVEPIPVTVVELARAHDRKFVEDVLACRAPNGFGNRSREVADSLPYTSGAMLSAARRALETKSVAAAPCSGFHHAGHARAEGFCTFNGLMVTALALKEEKLAESVGILDLDMHYGNGTDNIIQKLGIDWVHHFTAGMNWTRPDQAKVFLEEGLEENLDRIVVNNVDIVLYQAGADPHIHDPYGGWLTTEQLRERDRIVFQTFFDYGIPVAWNLAGGYQVEEDGSIPKVLEIHDHTMFECMNCDGYEDVEQFRQEREQPTGFQIVDITVGSTWLYVSLARASSEYVLLVQRDRFERIRKATTEQLQRYELLADGSAVHWPAIDEDLSIDGLLRHGMLVGPNGSLVTGAGVRDG